MRIYNHQTRKTSKRRAQFARAITFKEFGYHHGRVLDQGGIVDRFPHQRPLRIDEIGRRS